MSPHTLIRVLLIGISIMATLTTTQRAEAEPTRPNILWITSEDNGPHLGCYGDTYADTPHIDALAAKSLRFRHCWSNAPVCAPARTTIISGMHATSLGGHHMRSGVRLPADMKLYPQVLREADYYCTNHSKTDYNFANGDAGWQKGGGKSPWRNRPDESTPFMSVINFTISHESQIRKRPHTLVHDPAKAPLPKYHPDTPEVRHDWAQYYDKLTEMDKMVGSVLKDLEADGLADSTIIFYYGDHGSGMPRSKRWPFDSGLRVPLLVHVPEQFRSLAPKDYTAGGESTQLVSFVDLAPTVISLAGVKPPAYMQGTAFAGAFAGPSKPYLFGWRGRMDERVDMVRSCTDGRYVYMRHFYPDRPYLKHVDYMFQTPTTRVWKQMFDEGKLNQDQAKFWQPKPAEELFDLESDPDEVNNLAGDAEHTERVSMMRDAVHRWMVDTGDMGMFPEAEMHRVVPEDQSPREYALSHTALMTRLAETALDATNFDSDMTTEKAIELSADPDAVIRFWAVRGIGIRNANTPAAIQAVKRAMNDESPSVAIAACEAMQVIGDKADQQAVTDRLLELANVQRVGHFAAIEALNVLDLQIPLDAKLKKQIAALPRSLRKPPPRVGKYVGRLVDDISSATP
ncbi:sulfatase-like hydrolase/transferase [Novipirellula maiorica]|uniref:sulfatase-like hydrolase/transferase n=1 Tax=Novipirellula maiorica TaxID=1265734 RepID=UPI00034CB8BE|nr:sulfatase-like hydrolase/transferase [Rhodopirellula maiorica]